jgi:hypothetical protein
MRRVFLLCLQESRFPLAHKRIACHFEAEPAARHARRDLEQVGHNALVQAPDALGAHNRADRVADAGVLVAHAAHSVDLESPPKDVEGVGDGLRDSSRDCARTQFADCRWVFLTFGCKLCPRHFVDHEIETDIGCYSCDGRNDATVECRKASFCFVHVGEERPHAWQLFASTPLET